MKLPLFANLPLKDLRISAETINALESIQFSGPIRLVENDEDIAYALDKLAKARLLGFDTESRPAFLKGQKFPVSIIQLSLPDEAFIFRLKKTGFPDGLMRLLSSDVPAKVGVGVADDIKRLKELRDFVPGGFLDLCEKAKRKGIIQSSARALTARYLGKKLVKSAQKTNWARGNLSEKQLRYAATDAWICLLLLEPLEKDTTDYFALYQSQNAEPENC